VGDGVAEAEFSETLGAMCKESHNPALTKKRSDSSGNASAEIFTVMLFAGTKICSVAA